MKLLVSSTILVLLLIGLGVYFFLNQELLVTLDKQLDKQLGNTTLVAETKKVDPIIKVEKPAASKKSTNAAAEGLSKFYASISSDMSGKGPKIRNNIVYLPDPKGDIVKILEERRVVVRPLRETWQGTIKSRPFRLGETLFQKLSEYAKEDGLEVIWWLNRDFVVKDAFRINKDILKTAFQIAHGIEGHFVNGVSTYFCYQQRAIVLLDTEVPYFDEECILIKSMLDSN